MNNTGYLDSLPPWQPEQAQAIAQSEGEVLQQEHIEVLLAARHFYQQYGFSPSMRPLCKVVSEQLGLDKGRSIYLLQLFPGSPAKLVAKYAGLPAPKNCI